MDWFLYDRDLRHERVNGLRRNILEIFSYKDEWLQEKISPSYVPPKNYSETFYKFPVRYLQRKKIHN